MKIISRFKCIVSHWLSLGKKRTDYVEMIAKICRVSVGDILSGEKRGSQVAVYDIVDISTGLNYEIVHSVFPPELNTGDVIRARLNAIEPTPEHKQSDAFFRNTEEGRRLMSLAKDPNPVDFCTLLSYEKLSEDRKIHKRLR